MKRRALLLAILLCISSAAHADDETLRKASCYIRAYPDFFIAYKEGYLITKDGRRITFDSRIRSKDYDRMVVDRHVGDDRFNPEDALYWNYRARSEIPTVEKPPIGDPGRIRPAAIFGYMYGTTRAQRMKRMRPVHWVGPGAGGGNIIFVTTVNGVDKALEEVAREIRNLPEDKKKDLEGIVLDPDACSGYCDRPVRCYPHRTSAHAYGIAVDVNEDMSFFVGSHRGEPYRYRNNMPQFLVDIFERHGFIWGGRWHSYDIMHFEYRPELLLNDNGCS
ncbi:MAG TPA: M15 family metallopeptidase, partial [Desulfomonilia bacterium]|nr:M15 family metallopeptidase [Desulfomonilia bacterium]